MRMVSETGVFLRLLRIIFGVVWGVPVLRPVVRRWWPAVRVRIGGHTMLLHPADNYTERFMWRRGMRCEAASIERLTLLVAGKRALIFDVGANCGTFTLPLAAASASGSRIVAFEPNPAMANRLRINLELNGLARDVELEEVAVGSTEGIAYLHLRARNLGQSSLVWIKNTRKIPVAVRPLAYYLPEKNRSYDVFVVKIDVEGYEDKVLIPFLISYYSFCGKHAGWDSSGDGPCETVGRRSCGSLEGAGLCTVFRGRRPKHPFSTDFPERLTDSVDGSGFLWHWRWRR